MKTRFAIFIGLCCPLFIFSQHLEVDGKLKIMKMDTLNNENLLVIKQPDGTLGVRENATLSPTQTYTIGERAQGGVVFWLDPSGQHGKVVSMHDIGKDAWSNINLDIGSTAGSETNGAGNTVAITMQSGHVKSAARHCTDLAYGGYDDWYLPSKDELNQLYINRVATDQTVIACGGDRLGISGSCHWYWTSTEVIGSNTVVVQLMCSSGDQVDQSKNAKELTRAIRAF